jgi:ribA/ribD-fused uncharacterized protein
MASPHKNSQYIFFYGHTKKESKSVFSQFYPCEFTDENGVLYNCAEQYMMAHKALTFNDNTTYEKIMQASNPKDIKALGRLVKNFNEIAWDDVKFEIVLKGNVLKFSQNLDLKEILAETHKKILVEASPYDKVWGIGLNESTASSTPESKWPGKNLLGKALMMVREKLK